MTTDAQSFVVRDRGREITFTGVHLAHASSDEEGKRRWTEVDIYRTRAGQYVVACAGHSRIKRDEWYWDDRLGEQVRSEKDEEPRYWAQVCVTATSARESLTQVDGAGVRYLTRVARLALEIAGQEDVSIRRAFEREEVA